MMVVDALGSAMAPAAMALPWIAGAVDDATLDGVGLDGEGRHRLGCHRSGRCVEYYFVCLRPAHRIGCLRPGCAITAYNYINTPIYYCISRWCHFSLELMQHDNSLWP